MDVQDFMLAASRPHGAMLLTVCGLTVCCISLIIWVMKIDKRLNQLEEQQKLKDGGGE
jgi:hypothetical protein